SPTTGSSRASGSRTSRWTAGCWASSRAATPPRSPRWAGGARARRAKLAPRPPAPKRPDRTRPRRPRDPGAGAAEHTMTLPAGELTSIRSPRVKAARQLGKRALRQRARRFLAEGPQAAGEALAAGVVSQLFVTAAALARYQELASRAAGQGVDVAAVSGEVMAELAQTVTPQGILAVCRFIDVDLAQVFGTAAPPALVVVLASVRDPGNAGTVLRTADAAGAAAVL